MKLAVSYTMVVVLVLMIGGCASMTAPSYSRLHNLPLIELGQKAPENNEYILYLRSGVKIPVKLSISGSMLSKSSDIETYVQLKRDIYIYKKWSSLDGKTWDKRNINLKIASGMDSKGGKVKITVDELAR